MVASDNVQDPFCSVGSYDPMDALNYGVPLAQLPDAFDLWSQAICRSDWLGSKHTPSAPKPLSAGSPANLVIFDKATLQGFPARSHDRLRVRGGLLLDKTTLT
jgi:cytosine deaminase